MSDGYHGLLAPWIGGAGNDPSATAVGYRGLLAPWIGGAGIAPITTAVGYRGMLAPWFGGVGSLAGEDVTPASGGQLYSGRAMRIHSQNTALIAALTAMAAQGAFQ